jgi:hypothetical protein
MRSPEAKCEALQAKCEALGERQKATKDAQKTMEDSQRAMEDLQNSPQVQVLELESLVTGFKQEGGLGANEYFNRVPDFLLAITFSWQSRR